VNKVRDGRWPQPLIRGPLFQGTRDLKFTREDITAIRAAEGARGYPPDHQNPAVDMPDFEHLVADLLGGIVHGVGTLVRFIFAAAVIGAVLAVVVSLVSPSQSNNTQTHPRSAERRVEAAVRGESSAAFFPRPATEVASDDATGNMHPSPTAGPTPAGTGIGSAGEISPNAQPQEETGVRTETVPAGKEQAGAQPETQSPPVVEPEADGPRLASPPQESQPEREPAPQVQQEDKEQFRDADELFEVLAAKGYSNEVVQSLRERRWVKATAGNRTFLYAGPRFDSEARWIFPGSRYLVIDTHLRCSKIKAVTWKFAFIRWSRFEAALGFVCSPDQGKGAGE
jgi:hypothetical protein